MAEIPETMRSLVAPNKCLPAGYEVMEVPVPKIRDPHQVLLRIHAAGIGNGELQIAAGNMSIIVPPQEYPLKIGIAGAGVVAAVGSEVKTLKVGDAAYGLVMNKPAYREAPPGFVSDYAICDERFLVPTPPHVSFEEAASYAGSVVTAYQAIRLGLRERNEASLEGKTVFVPAGLSATGSIAAQVAKNVFGAEKIITTVSTAKVPLLEQYLPGIFDQVIDYKTTQPRDAVPEGSVDFMYNTQWGSLTSGIPLLNRKTGTLVSIAGVPNKATANELFGEDRIPFWLRWLFGLAMLWYRWQLRGTNTKYNFLSGGPNIREDVEKAGEFVAQGKVRPVMTVEPLEDLDAVKKAMHVVLEGKGGLGKLVVKIV